MTLLLMPRGTWQRCLVRTAFPRDEATTSIVLDSMRRNLCIWPQQQAIISPMWLHCATAWIAVYEHSDSSQVLTQLAHFQLQVANDLTHDLLLRFVVG